MDATNFTSANAVFKAPEGMKDCYDLPVRKTHINGQRCIVSVWKPTEDEIARILVGESVLLCVVGESMPPVCLLGGEASAKIFEGGW
jgi:hypothetical protein